MNIITPELVAFCGKDNTKFYEQFADYYFHRSDAEWKRKLGDYDHSVTIATKQAKVNDAFFAEIERMSGVPRTAENADTWASHPNVSWAQMSILNSVANAILPAYVTASLAPFVDFKTVGYGDNLIVKIEPRTLYTVSLGAHGQRTIVRQKKYAGNVTIAPVEHIVTVYVDWYRVMARKEDIAEAVRKVILSVEIEMNKDAYSALSAGLTGIDNAFKVSGAFNTQSMIQLCQRVEAYNNGMKPVVMGTASALSNVLPSATAGYRMNIDGANGSVKYMGDFYGYDLHELPQMPKGDANYGLILDDTMLYVVSPTVGNKLVQGVMSTGIANNNQFFDNSDLTSNYTFRKDWKFDFIGAAFAGTYDITA